MPETAIESTDYGDVRTALEDFSIAAQTTDAPDGDKEYRYNITRWEDYLGYYKEVPELQVAVDAKANWTMGAGYESDEITGMLLDRVTGHGKETFNTILKNLIRTYTIAGDSFAEIITDKNGYLMNLKPLNPGSMVIVSNQQGRITKYEQSSRKGGIKKSFQIREILHLSRKRIADEIHGISVIPAVENIILMRNEAMSDWRRVLHRNVDPLFIFHVDTDDATEIADFKNKVDQSRKHGENLIVPKGAVVPEHIATAQNSTLNPLAWINQLNDYFFQAVNVPQIIIGNSKEFTDASGKIVYLSYEQSVKDEQLYIEEQVAAQLNLRINLVFPASLQNELISSKEKDSNMQAAAPNDVTAEMEGKK